MSVRLARGLATVGYFGLLGLWIAWSILPEPARRPPTSLMLAVSTLPLLLPLRGLLHDSRSSFIWLGLLSLPYFIHGVGAVIAGAERGWAGLEIGLSLLLFGACTMRLRCV